MFEFWKNWDHLLGLALGIYIIADNNGTKFFG